MLEWLFLISLSIQHSLSVIMYMCSAHCCLYKVLLRKLGNEGAVNLIYKVVSLLPLEIVTRTVRLN